MASIPTNGAMQSCKKAGAKRSSSSNSEPAEPIDILDISPKRSKTEKVEAERFSRAVRDEILHRAMSISVPLVHPNITTSWYSVLCNEFSKPYFKELDKFITLEREENTVYPPADKVWAWTELPLENIKVVILGQDPYHGPGQATGLSFSVGPGIEPPGSLKNMYAELTTDIEGFTRPSHGNLTGWMKQGVLLLNTTLTVRATKPKSHTKQGWELLTDEIIRQVNEQCEGVVFMLWGLNAQMKVPLIDQKKHHILTANHPSPLSAFRGFMGCRHFSKCNKMLEYQGKEPIDWAYLPEE